jgi:hypothetical protein
MAKFTSSVLHDCLLFIINKPNEKRKRKREEEERKREKERKERKREEKKERKRERFMHIHMWTVSFASQSDLTLTVATIIHSKIHHFTISIMEDYRILWRSLEKEDRELLSRSFRYFLLAQGLGIYIGGGFGYMIGKQQYK